MKRSHAASSPGKAEGKRSPKRAASVDFIHRKRLKKKEKLLYSSDFRIHMDNLFVFLEFFPKDYQATCFLVKSQNHVTAPACHFHRQLESFVRKSSHKKG